MYQTTYINLVNDNPVVYVPINDTVRQIIIANNEANVVAINASTAIKAFLQVVKHDMKEDILTPESIKEIKDYLEGLK